MTKLLLRYLRPYKGQVALLVFFQVIQAFLNLYLPNLQAEVIDQGVAVGNARKIYHIGFVMIVIAVVQGLANIAAVVVCSRISTRLAYEVRRDFFSASENLCQAEVDRYSTGSLITRSTNDIYQVQNATFQAFLFVLQAPIMFVGGLVMAIQQNGELTWSIAVILPIVLLVAGIIFSKIGPLFKRLQAKLDAINLVIREQVTGVRVVRAFVRESTESQRFEKANTETSGVLLPVGFLMGALGPIMWFITSIFNIAIMWFGGHLIESGNMKIGALQAFIQYLMIIIMGFMMAAMMSVMLPRASVASKRLLEVIDQKPSVAAPAQPYFPQRCEGRLEFQDVSFTYPGASAPVLEHVSFVAEPGQTTAFIGATGAGKTTVLDLAQRIYDATDGRILLDGHDLREFDPRRLATLFGPVPQTARLFTGTVRSNMRFGKADATDEEIWQALEIAQAEDFVREMPDGLDTRVSEGGTNFSGGQKQRLCIARALLRDPALYAMDDSFSALDMTTDRKLRLALRPVVSRSTFLLVAQRAASIRDAEKIIVLDKGRIVGEGDHESLMKDCDVYRQIVDSQGGDGGDAVESGADADQEGEK